MALNKIVYKDRTLIDLTNTTAVQSDVFTGKIFHKADGTTAVGTGGGSLELCLKHSTGQYDPPTGAYQTIVGDIGFIINTGRSKIVIFNANITASGVIVEHQMWDIIAYSVTPGQTLETITNSWTGGLVYTFFNVKPTLGAQSYNSSRVVLNSNSATNVIVPSGCYWIAIRPEHGGTANVI